MSSSFQPIKKTLRLLIADGVPRSLTPSLPQTALAQGQPSWSRVLCMDCQGKGTRSIAADIADCSACISERNYGNFCHEHVCHMCDGKGVVCPLCKGMRFGNEESRYGTKLVRCTGCTNGNNIDDQAEMRLIRRYLDKYPGLPDAERVAAEKARSVEAMERAKAYDLAWGLRHHRMIGGRAESPFEQRLRLLRETYGDPVDMTPEAQSYAPPSNIRPKSKGAQ